MPKKNNCYLAFYELIDNHKEILIDAVLFNKNKEEIKIIGNAMVASLGRTGCRYVLHKEPKSEYFRLKKLMNELVNDTINQDVVFLYKKDDSFVGYSLESFLKGKR